MTASSGSFFNENVYDGSPSDCMSAGAHVV
jgi:hypothetical protein